MKKQISILMSLILALSIALGAFITADAYDSPVTSYNVKNGLHKGSRSLAEVLGFDYDTYLKWLDDHDDDSRNKNYYIGTQYAIGDCRNPNGDRYNSYGISDVYGRAGLNCTGFIWHVMYMACTSGKGGSLDGNHDYYTKTGVKIPTLGTGSRWYDMYSAQDVERYYFISKNEMLKSGVLDKGDIIWQFTNYSVGGAAGENIPNDFHHIGIYYGNGTSDLYWHSTSAGNNHISKITAIAPVSFYCVLKANRSVSLNINLRSAQELASPGFEDGYDFNGAQFSVYTDSDCSTPLVMNGKSVVITLDKNGNGSLPYYLSGDTVYYAKQTAVSTGYRQSSDIYTFRGSGKKDENGIEIFLPSTLKNGAKNFKLTNAARCRLRIKNAGGSDGSPFAGGAQGEVYSVYLDKDCTLEFKRSDGSPVCITADENGCGEFFADSDMPHPNRIFYAKETFAPSGYTPDPRVYTFSAENERNAAGLYYYSFTYVGCKRIVLLGDVNDDGSVSLSDAILVQKYSVSGSETDSEQLRRCDVNRDGELSLADAVLIQKYALSLSDNDLGIGQDVNRLEG